MNTYVAQRLTDLVVQLALTLITMSAFAAPASLTPQNLLPSIGPVVAPQAGRATYLNQYDTRFQANELLRFNNFLAIENDPGGAYLDANHYGGLRSRLMWALRKGEPVGAAANDEAQHAYARGRRIIKRYLQYSKVNNYATMAHHNTGMADIEAYYLLEGDIDAKNHIWVTAVSGTYDNNKYYFGTNTNTDARTVTVALQGFMAAQRLGIPFARPPFNGGIGFDSSPGSWKGAGQRQIGWLLANWVKADGSIPSPAHAGAEAYLFNAWLATELFNWYAYMDPDPAVFALGKKIFDHLIDKYETVYVSKGWNCMPYLSNSTYAATDLAAFFIWPSLVLWQSTGVQKYYDFAVTHLQASNTSTGVSYLKQWNQIYSTRGQSAEALLAGVPWSASAPPNNDQTPPAAPSSLSSGG